MVTPEDQHGGNIFAASRALGLPPTRLLDFSASVNPLGPSPRARAVVSRAARALVHYPDPSCVELREALARRHRLSPDRFLIGNGSSELIHLLPLGLSMARVIIVGPTFSEYERASKACGARVTRLQAVRSQGYRPPLAEAVRIVKRLGSNASRTALFLCNPNSPTGQSLDPEELRTLVRVAARRRTLTILDETFVDYCESRSLVTEAAAHDRLLVLRSFTKFYGLAGLRVGYLVGPPPLLGRVRARQAPWSVNALAQDAARTALADRRHARRSLAYVPRERADLAKGLATLGFTTYPSTANFLMAECPPGWSAAALTAALRQRGVLVRDLSRVPGLTARTVRIAVRPRHERRRLLSYIRSILSGARA